MEVVIEKFMKDYVDEVYRIENEAIKDPWSYESIANILKYDTNHYYVAIVEGRVVGFVGMILVADQGDITSIAVDKELRGQGIGDELLNYAIKVAGMMDVQVLNLEVRESNDVAISLYKKYNFTEIFIRDNYYLNPKENAVIMQLDVKI